MGLNVLFITSEALPLIKTGGLADVCGSLPSALRASGHDVRLLLPAYPAALAKTLDIDTLGTFKLNGETAELLKGKVPGHPVPVYLLNAPQFFERDGAPYTGPDGKDWPDNAQRFALFARMGVELGMGRADPQWQPEIVHCHDWQTGLTPALLSLEENPPGTVFTIHNMAYQGVFDAQKFLDLGLPSKLWHWTQLEFWQQLSFMKGGLAFADRLTTVSPTYAGEIQTPALGYGLDGLLRNRSQQLQGILNGVDYKEWDPSHDPALPANYTADDLSGKALNKAAIQDEFGLPKDPDAALIGHVGRLVAQKGLDLVLEAIPSLLKRPFQMVILGTGDIELEQRLRKLAKAYPNQIGVKIGYSESIAHQIEAASDIFLMPSRFEPCGLNQIYSLRYAALPVVHRTGGLADTVIDWDANGGNEDRATGFVFDFADVKGVLYGVNKALDAYADKKLWAQLQRNAMAQDFSWDQSAQRYADLYREILAERIDA